MSCSFQHLHSSRYLLPPPPSVASRSRPFSKPPSNIPSAAHSKVPSKNPTPIPESPVQPILRSSPVIRPASKAQMPPAKSPTVKTPRQETPAEKKTLDAVLDIVANISNSFKRGNNHLLAVNFFCAWLLIQCTYLQYVQYNSTHTYNTMQYIFILYAINYLFARLHCWIWTCFPGMVQLASTLFASSESSSLAHSCSDIPRRNYVGTQLANSSLYLYQCTCFHLAILGF